MSGSNTCFLIYIQVSKETEMVWYSHLFKNFPQSVAIHTVKGSTIVNEAEVYVFMKFTRFSYDPPDADNLISGSSAFSKSSLYIWKLSAEVQLKPSLKDFENYLANMWNEHNWIIVWTFFGIVFLWNWNEKFTSPETTAEFSKFADILSAALSQPHLLEFEIAQLEFHHLH